MFYGKMDDPKTKDYLWDDCDDDEPTCYGCGVATPEHEYLGEPYCEDCLYEAYMNDLDDCQCSFEDFKWGPQLKHI